MFEYFLFNGSDVNFQQIAVEAKSQVELLRLQNADRWALKSCSESPDDRSISKATNKTIVDKVNNFHLLTCLTTSWMNLNV